MKDLTKLIHKGSILSDVEFIVDTTATISAIAKLEYFYSYWPTNKTII
jgi:hypothetical protein